MQPSTGTSTGGRFGAGPAGERAAFWHYLAATIALIVLPALSFGSNAPTIQLVPTAVLEDIRQTGNVAAEMETGLQEAISRLDQQRRLYQEARCEGAGDDPGCQRIAKQLGATYLEMLNIMSERLPDMERSVQNTHASLERRLRSELGNKMTSWTLQETLLGAGEGSKAEPAPVLRGRSGIRLSQRFEQYYQLVATSSVNRNSHSLAVIAADMYLDMAEASDLIARTREEIARATLMEQLNQSFGVITPEMQEVVDGVKAILFGDYESGPQIAAPPPGTFEEEYVSPLEF